MEYERIRIIRLSFYSLLTSVLFILSQFRCSSKNDENERQFIGNLSPIQYYSTHSAYTDPGEYAYLYEGIPSDILRIVQTVQGVLIHAEQIKLQDIRVSKRRTDREINIRKVKDMLKRLSKMHNQPIIIRRPVDERLIGICAHFALLTCSVLRHKGIPARSRGGFETYHSKNTHHDHWICEYWSSDQERWIQIDPEINPYLNDKWNIDFDCLDLPPGTFMTGAETWKYCRKGLNNPDHFGIRGVRWYGGWDFVLNEMVLDFLALNKIELLPWDGNDLSEKGVKHLKHQEHTLLDSASALVLKGDDYFNDIINLYKTNKTLHK